jgi:hypothetical protein
LPLGEDHYSIWVGQHGGPVQSKAISFKPIKSTDDCEERATKLKLSKAYEA